MDIRQMHRQKRGHLWWVGLLGMVAGAILLVYVPTLKAISTVLLLFAGFHLIGAIVLFASAYVMGGDGLLRRFLPRSNRRQSRKPDFGWASAWIFAPWIAALILLAGSIALQQAAHNYWPLATMATLLAAAFFAGGLLTRNSGKYDHAVLPMTALLPNESGESVVLDAGCGAGRTTVSLARAFKACRIVALDRFDSSYIDGGGRSLFEENLSRFKLTDRVRIDQGDMTALLYKSDTFDAAVSAHAIDHLGSMTQQGLNEIRRVLKPGGRFLLVVWVPGWSMFAISNVLSFFLASKSAWRKITAQTGFAVLDEGNFSGTWFLLLEKPEAK